MEKINKPYLAKNFFKTKRIKAVLGLLFISILTVACGYLLKFDFLLIFEKMSAAMARFVKLYLPPNFKNWKDLVDGIFVTLILAVSGGLIGSFFAYIAALLMSSKTRINPIIGGIVRFFSTFMRNVPSSIWAIILLMAFWFGEFLALLVISIGTFGFNARVFADTFEESNTDSIEALNAVGASRLQIIRQSIYPESLPAVISWTLYAIETNIRDSTVIGMLTGGGIGHWIGVYRNFRRFDELTAAVLVTVVFIILFNSLTDFIRGKLNE